MKDEPAPEVFSYETLCRAPDGRMHEPQLAFCQDRSPWLHIMAARQSGKSQGDCFKLLGNAMERPGTTNIFLGLKGTGVKFSMWQPVWLPLCSLFGVDDRQHNLTSMLTTLENGSRVVFAGTDDLENLRKYLGNRLAGGIVIIDEAQSQKDELLKYLLFNLLPPMLDATSQVILSGVLPDVPTGLFYELAADKPLADGGDVDSKGYRHHEWGRVSNVHTPNAMQELVAYCARFKIDPEKDPQILRDWYLKRVWDPNAAAYQYVRERNGYEPSVPSWLNGFASDLLTDGIPGTVMAARPWQGIDTISVALDPGGVRDRVAIEVTGWGTGTPDVQHLFEYASPKAARLTWDQMGRILGHVAKQFDPLVFGQFWTYDAGSSQNELDTFARLYGVPVLKCAQKADLPGQVRLCNTLLRTGVAKVMIGSELEADLQKARWDETAARDRRFEWASSYHPDPSEAWRYSLRPYCGLYMPPDLRSPTERSIAAEEQAYHHLYNGRPSGYESWNVDGEHQQSDVYGGPTDG